jgi:hypothetical protein
MKRLKNVKPSTSLYGVFSTIGQANYRLPSGVKTSAKSAGGIPKVSMEKYKGAAQLKLERIPNKPLSLFDLWSSKK